MPLKQDENETGTLYLRNHIDTVGALVSFNITGDGVSGKKVLAGFTSDDASGIGEMRLTNQGTQIALANNMGNRLPLTGIFTLSPEILIFDYTESTDSILTDTVMYHIDDSLTYPYDTAVYVAVTTEEFALDTNISLGRTATALRSLEFADNSRYVYFTRSNIRGEMVGYTIADSTYVNDSLTNTGGNIRRGEDGIMYTGLMNGMRTISNASSLTPSIDFEDFGIASVNYNVFGSGSSPQLLKTGPISVVQKGIYTRTLNQKYYELADHLGNIRAVVKDYKEKKSGNLWPSAVSYADYYAFGMMLPSRNANPGDYRFGFNGKENDNEVKGTGNQQDYGMRIYDPRIARFLSVDPLNKDYPWFSTYQFAGNNPISFIDLDGLEPAAPPSTNYVIAEGFRQYFDALVNLFTFKAEISPGFKHIDGETKGDNVSTTTYTEYKNTSSISYVGWDLFNPAASSNGTLPAPKISITSENTVQKVVEAKANIGQVSFQVNKTFSSNGEVTSTNSFKMVAVTNGGTPVSISSSSRQSNLKGSSTSITGTIGSQNANLYIKQNYSVNNDGLKKVTTSVGVSGSLESPKVKNWSMFVKGDVSVGVTTTNGN